MVYIDDILVYSKTMEQHKIDVGEVLQALQEAGLKIKPEKCTFLCDEVPFFGHIISAEGVRPDPEKVKVILDFPVPTNTTEILSFLGIFNWFKKFVPGLAELEAPLYALTKKGRKFEWGEIEQLPLKN